MSLNPMQTNFPNNGSIILSIDPTNQAHRISSSSSPSTSQNRCSSLAIIDLRIRLLVIFIMTMIVLLAMLFNNRQHQIGNWLLIIAIFIFLALILCVAYYTRGSPENIIIINQGYNNPQANDNNHYRHPECLDDHPPAYESPPCYEDLKHC